LIRRLSSLSYSWLAFAPLLEQQYASDTGAFRDRRRWFEGILSVSLYLAFSVTSWLTMPGQSESVFLIRIGLVSLLFLLLYIAIRHHPLPWLREISIVLASCTLGSVEVFLHLTQNEGVGYSPQFAIVGVLVFTNTLMRLRFPFAIVSFVWAVGAEYFLRMNDLKTTGREHLVQAMVASTIALLSIIANYSQDREARLAFLKYVQKKEQVGSLSLSNEHLANAALTDSLTELANRSSLNSYLTTVWSRPSLATTECSLVMVDIDHFKNLNDRYGHLYGDRVIRRVAHLMSEALRGEDDFIARYGGEEFVVVLPHTPIHLGIIVAERLRGLVELAGLPSLRSGDPNLEGMRATISCGIAAGIPESCSDPSILIEAADQALYTAKRDGRNRVREWAGDADNSARRSLARPLGTTAPIDSLTFG
jgi:diguanylate cyclase (GGDEF)-like protein